tara:strand:+ start:22 stop:1929 length:1908 start_codon:yes stop_codon:yes gene_type:complete
MAVNTKRLNVTEFDFDEVKNNLKVFLSGQTEFTDYDFEGSGMNALLDVLAYNTHYLGFNANMLANEMFLDSASLRSSVVSHAKTLGYVPNSARAAVATVNITLNTTSITSATLPAGTVFNSTVNGTDYQFVTSDSIASTNTGSGIPFLSVNLYEGTFVTTRYSVDSTDADQRFLVPNRRADTSTLKVVVQNSSSDSTTTTYTQATDITQVTAESNVYFLQEVENGKFEVYFGDGVVGSSLSDGNIVILTYVVSNTTDANGAAIFKNAASIATISDISVEVLDIANGGSAPETITSIKYNAPLDYASQGRCVTAEDYKVYAKKLYANTKSVQVFGGESGSFDSSLGVVSTAEYGKVFISILSTTGLELTASEKKQLVSDFAKYTVASITPVIVDPETTFLILDVRFKYDSSKTTLATSQIESEVVSAITKYNTDNLEKFEGVFRHSKVTRLIDDANTSILNNTTNVNLGKFFAPDTTAATSYNIYFNNALYNPHSGHNSSAGGILASTGFFINGDTTNEHFLDDNGAGIVRLYYVLAGNRVYVDTTAGTINYSTGAVFIESLFVTTVSDVDGATSTEIRITVVPNSKDIVPVRNQTLKLDLTNSTVLGEVDTVSVGDTSAAGTYTTSTSYSTPSGY